MFLNALLIKKNHGNPSVHSAGGHVYLRSESPPEPLPCPTQPWFSCGTASRTGGHEMNRGLSTWVYTDFSPTARSQGTGVALAPKPGTHTGQHHRHRTQVPRALGRKTGDLLKSVAGGIVLLQDPIETDSKEMGCKPAKRQSRRGERRQPGGRDAAETADPPARTQGATESQRLGHRAQEGGHPGRTPETSGLGGQRPEPAQKPPTRDALTRGVRLTLCTPRGGRRRPALRGNAPRPHGRRSDEPAQRPLM